MTFPSVTLVVPFLNEAKAIEDVLNGVLGQETCPQELLFIDAGSTDETVAIIQRWQVRHPEFDLRVLSSPGALPGAARNLGVQHAKYEWIAFLDAGIRPSSKWLKSLMAEAMKGVPGVWGCCLYEGQGNVGVLTGAYSLGQMSTVEYFLASSLFHKDVFQKIGFFREDLRAAEDLLWRAAYFTHYRKPTPVPDAMVFYRRFPESVWAVYKKWMVYADHTAFAGANIKQQIAYGVLFGGLIVTIVWQWWTVVGVLAIVYGLGRGMLDPIRRSRASPWWGDAWWLAVLGPFFVLGLDVAKGVGFLKGNLRRSKISPTAP